MEIYKIIQKFHGIYIINYLTKKEKMINKKIINKRKIKKNELYNFIYIFKKYLNLIFFKKKI